MPDAIETREVFGAVVVERDHGDGHTERWWFHETEAGRLVLCAQIDEYDEAQHDFPVRGRHFTARSELDAPECVREVLDGRDHSGLYVQRGHSDSGVVRLE